MLNLPRILMRQLHTKTDRNKVQVGITVAIMINQEALNQ